MESVPRAFPVKLNFNSITKLSISILFICMMLASCNSVRKIPRSSVPYSPNTYEPQKYGIKDKNPEMWNLSNQRVNTYVGRFNKTKTVETCLKRSQQNGYLKHIHRVFYQRRLPPELAHLPMVESCFDAKAKSRTGALGMWQFNEITAREFNLDQGILVDDRYDWKKSTQAAAEYFDRLGKRFDYDWALALAGYNGGPNYLAKTMKQQGKDNYWDLDLREEPRNYVPKFLAMLQVAKEKYPSLYYQGAPKFWIVAAN
jgi:membrane-bound lytic murein transglycosylase D